MNLDCEVSKELKMGDGPRIGIVGAGVVGLTTALLLHDELRGSRVTVLADKFETETTSSVAAGVFRPGTSFCAPDDKTTKLWVNDSWSHWSDLLKTSEASNAGVTLLSGYIFSKRNPSVVRNHLIEDIVPIYRTATEEELKLCGNDWKYGSFFTTMLIESRLYLPWAKKKFFNNGGVVRKQQIESFSDITKDYDVIVNCTGLGARELCNDVKLVPMRGQIIKVKAPWLKMAFYGDYDAYILPGFEGVTLGGTRQYDSFNLDVCKYDAAGIMDRCAELIPALRTAEVIRHAVGLRPHRSPVRVEGELVQFPYKRTKIVHCYGHGGYGVTCAPGTAKHAVSIVRDMLATSSKL